MQRRLFLKVAAIGLLSMLLLIPLWMIEAQIAARGARQADVVRDIAESAAAEQTLIGPVLVVRYRERVKVRDKEVSGREAERHEVLTRSLVLPPQVLGIDGDARVETRSRGLYRASLYHLALDLRGRVSVPARLGLGDEREAVVREPLDHPHLPQRLRGVELLRQDAAAQSLQLPLLAGLRQGGVADVVEEVEAVVVDPHRVMQSQRHGQVALAQLRRQREPAGKGLAKARPRPSGLVAAGVDALRLNCAHDGPEAWAAIVERAEARLATALRRAGAALMWERIWPALATAQTTNGPSIQGFGCFRRPQSTASAAPAASRPISQVQSTGARGGALTSGRPQVNNARISSTTSSRRRLCAAATLAGWAS